MHFVTKKLFRILACCELMKIDHWYTQKTKKGEKRVLVKGDRLRFVTLTVPESGLPLFEVSARFRMLSNSRWWRDLMRNRSYVCVYEPHPNGHGWHIHILTNIFIPWRELDVVCRAYLFGHTDIEAANSDCAFYVAKYITKAQVFRKVQDSRHCRIVNVSRDLLPLYDVECHSSSIDYIRENWDSVSESLFIRSHILYCKWVKQWSGYSILALNQFEKYL